MKETFMIFDIHYICVCCIVLYSTVLYRVEHKLISKSHEGIRNPHNPDFSSCPLWIIIAPRMLLYCTS